MEEILKTIVSNLVDNKEAVEIRKVDKEKTTIFEVKVAENDMGRIIGKQGRIARAIRTVMKAVAAKTHKKITIEFIG